MSELQVRAILAGLFFGTWPFLMNRSGLVGSISAAIFSLGVFSIVFPFTLREVGRTYGNIAGLTAGTSYLFAVISLAILIGLLSRIIQKESGSLLMAGGACLFGAMGLIFFTSIISRTTKEEFGPLFVLMLATQIATPTIQQIIVNWGLTSSRIFGLVSAILAAVFAIIAANLLTLK